MNMYVHVHVHVYAQQVVNSNVRSSRRATVTLIGWRRQQDFCSNKSITTSYKTKGEKQLKTTVVRDDVMRRVTCVWSGSPPGTDSPWRCLARAWRDRARSPWTAAPAHWHKQILHVRANHNCLGTQGATDRTFERDKTKMSFSQMSFYMYM